MAPFILMFEQELYFAADEAAVKNLCATTGVSHKNMRQMLGLPAPTKAGLRKRHVQHWVIPERLRFIKRDDCADVLAVIGGDAQYYIANYSRPDMSGFEPHRLNELLNSPDGLVRSHMARAPYKPASWSWRRAMEPPSIDKILQAFPWASAPWAPPQACHAALRPRTGAHPPPPSSNLPRSHGTFRGVSRRAPFHPPLFTSACRHIGIRVQWCSDQASGEAWRGVGGGGGLRRV